MTQILDVMEIEKDRVEGTIERITFHNPDNGFAVLRVRMKGQRDPVTWVGQAAELYIGAPVTAEGRWQTHAQHGAQFSWVTLQTLQPSSRDGLIKYLGSGVIHGIGPQTAKQLVNHFGENILKTLDDNPKKLLELEGIGKKRLQTIANSWEKQRSLREVMLLLQSHDVGLGRAQRIIKTLGSKALEVLKTNPYRLARDVEGIGFQTADRLAQSLGLPLTDQHRIATGILFVLQSSTEEGHCAVGYELLIQRATELLQVDQSVVEKVLQSELKNKSLLEIPRDWTHDQIMIAIPVLFHAEQGVARSITRLMSAKIPWQKHLASISETLVEEVKIKLSASQSAAIETVLHAKFSVMTGGPGVGKTTVIQTLLRWFEQKNLRVLLAAPTGRAAKRLSESTQREAKTLHRLLEYQPGVKRFAFDSQTQFTGDVLIVDEASMIDIVMANHLLEAVPDSMAVILVGDIDQLPSISPGNVLRDIIRSEIVAVARLTEIFRQAASSHIVQQAHRVRQGESPILNERMSELEDFYWIQANTDEEVTEKIQRLIKDRIPARFPCDPKRDIQILTPMQRGSLGARQLNGLMQSVLNPTPVGSIQRMGITYGVGDKIIQMVNNYDKEIFNGDIGFIESINASSEELHVRFDGRDVKYSFNELDDIQLAYAITIHKSQGSEYPIVVIPLMMQHYMLLQRNLLYTAMTRGRRLVILLSSEKAVRMAVRKESQDQRISFLDKRLQAANLV
ncbi:MAG: ATP-dependent RecD-like DNA helicase [Pseudomonadota bacterium]